MSSKEAVGSYKDPVVLESSSEDENNATTIAPAKRSAATEHEATHTKRPKNSETRNIPPTTPQTDPLQNITGGVVSKYVIYMCIEEGVPSKFWNGLEKCAQHCSEAVHKRCLQMDGTRHITLWTGNMTDERARRIRFEELPDLPLPIELQGWNSWTAGNYLKVSRRGTKRLTEILGQLEGLPVGGGKRSCDHLSLYRKRGVGGGDVVTAQFLRVRKALANHDWGSVQGVGVRIKVVGSDYSECRVLAGV